VIIPPVSKRAPIFVSLIAFLPLVGAGASVHAAAVEPLVRPAAGLIGGEGLGRPAFAFYRIWGTPSETASVVRPGWRTFTRMVWRGGGLSLVVSFKDLDERNAGGISYRGPLRTSRGDRAGTTLREFIHHWPTAQVTLLAAKVDRTTFIFDTNERLVGVELGVTPLP